MIEGVSLAKDTDLNVNNVESKFMNSMKVTHNLILQIVIFNLMPVKPCCIPLKVSIN